MTNRPHTPEPSANNTPDFEDSSSTGGPIKQGTEEDKEASSATLFKNPSSTISMASVPLATTDERIADMKITSTHNPGASHIRIKQHAVDFLIPPVKLPKHPNPTNVSVQYISGKVPEPPVTAKGLRELGIDKIMNSLKLRHDINFDAELHYRANLDGDMGRNKRAQGQEFWSKLLEDLASFTTDPKKFLDNNGADTWTLPVVLENIKAIIMTLVAPGTVRMVQDTLEIEHLMQELSKGVADLERWATSVAGFLSICCAPMRDDLVMKMKQRLIEGHRTHDIEIICDGVKQLLFLVEAMALDVANHQIRCLRRQMILETVNYERHFIEKMVDRGEFDIPEAYEWYVYYTRIDIPSAFQHQQRFATEPKHPLFFPNFKVESDGRAAGFYKGILHNLTYPLLGRPLPTTFAADIDRIGRLRGGVLEAVNFEVCVTILKTFMKPRDDGRPNITSNSELLRRALWTIVNDHCKDVDVLIPLSEMNTPHQQSLGIPRFFLQQKWKAAAPSAAIEIWRLCNLPMDMLPEIEDELVKHLSNDKSDLFLRCQAEVINVLGTLVKLAVDEWKSYNPWELYEAAAKSPATNERKWSRKVDPKNGNRMIIKNLAIVIAHMGLHHWWIWETLAYHPCSRFVLPSQRGQTVPMARSEVPSQSTIRPREDSDDEEEEDDYQDEDENEDDDEDEGVDADADAGTVKVEEEQQEDRALPRIINDRPDASPESYKHFCGQIDGRPDEAPLNPSEEASKAIVPEVSKDTPPPQQPKVENDRVDCIPKVEHSSKPKPRRQGSVCESNYEEDTIEPRAQEG